VFPKSVMEFSNVQHGDPVQMGRKVGTWK